MGKVSGGAGRTGFQLLNAQGGNEGVRGFAANFTQRQRQALATQEALRRGLPAIQRTTQEGPNAPIGRPTRVAVRVTGSGNVRPSTVGVHVFNFNGGQRAYSRSTYTVARRRAVADAAALGLQRISYVGTNG